AESLRFVLSSNNVLVVYNSGNVKLFSPKRETAAAFGINRCCYSLEECFHSKFWRSLQEHTHVEEDDVNQCNLERTETWNECEKLNAGKPETSVSPKKDSTTYASDNNDVHGKEGFSLQEEVDHKNEMDHGNVGNHDSTSTSLAPCNITEEIKPEDRHIVSMMHVFEELKSRISNHSMYNCSIQNIKLTAQRRCGLRTLFYFQCEMCGQVDKVWSEPDNNISNSLNINKAAVVGSHAAGFGHAQMEQMLAAINISCMSSKTSMKICEHDIFDRWLQCADSVMKAAEKERRIALETGRDSSVYHKIKIARPYGDIEVEKVDCVNHLFRCLQKNLKTILMIRNLGRGGRQPLVTDLKGHISSRIERIVRDVRAAAKYHISQEYDMNEK
ncbi:hypothetical protein PV326_014129, partial [Microctonus aethiopoides]